MKILEILHEAKVARSDPEMDEYYDKKQEKEADTKDAPYYVAWSGQSHEWYGDGDPDEGKGRYKQKGDGGRIVAINIPTHAEAAKIVKHLDKMYEENKFPDKAVYGRMGDDHYLVDYHGAHIRPMKSMDDYDKNHMSYHKPVDYAKGKKYKT